MAYDRQRLIKVLRHLGYTQAADDAARNSAAGAITCPAA
jgi:hypothetical protein